MSLYFEHPEALALCGLVALVVWLYRGSLVDQARAQKAISCGVRSLVVLLFAVAVAAPHLEFPSRKLAVAVLVDASASAEVEQSRSALAFAGDLRKTLGKDRVNVVLFAKHAWPVAEGGEELSGISKDEREGTDLERAVHLALASLPAGYVGRIVLASDGLANLGSVYEAVREAKDRDVPIFVRPYSDPGRPEVLVSEIRLPLDVQPGSSARAAVSVVSSVETAATLALFRNKWKLEAMSVKLAPGLNRFEVEMEVPDSRLLEVNALVSPDRDTYADNNYGLAVAPVRARPRLLYVASVETDARYLFRALTARNLQVDLRPPLGFPASLSELQNYDLVVLSGVPRDELPEGAPDLLEVYVRDLGGGLLTLGGERAYGLGGYADTALARMLPVEMMSQARRDVPSLALVLAIDKSGSMARQKLEMAKSAAIAASELLTQADYLGVVSFDAAAYALCPITSASERTAIIERIRRLQAGGGTNMYPALELARSQLLSVAARLKHVILLSDGKTGGSGYEDLVTRMSADGITVSTVAVGSESDRELLRSVAAVGKGRYYSTDDPTNVPQIFVKETLTVQRSSVVEEPFTPSVVGEAELLRGIPWSEAPPLYGYVSVSPRPLGEVLLASHRAEPILARWRYGLGKVASYMSDVSGRWGPDWVEWKYFAVFFSQLARDTMRSDPAGAGRASVALSQEPGEVRILADLVEDQGGFLNDAQARATVVGPSVTTRNLVLEQTAPGRYEGAFDTQETGAYLVRLDFLKEGKVLASAQSAAAKGYPEEYAAFGRNEALLHRLAEETGGAWVSDAAEVLAPDRRAAVRDIELSGAMLAAALVAFLVDILVRRLALWRNP
ncbi:MAG: VWA domain-containing protein [Planctomycetota bacterium]